MGRDAMNKSGKEKIDAVKDIKKYADLAIKYDSRNYKAWYVLGKWYYEINALNYFERTAVKLFFGALAPAHIDDAIHCFEKTKSINPGFVLNYLSLAKAYKKKDEEANAKQSLIAMLALPDKTQDDERIKNEGRDLLKKWN
jgi:tetratricopeptide (TPR) repeat protein